MAAGQDGDRRVVILPFDLRQSNLPLMYAFPIMMSNVLSYLSPPGVVGSPEIHTGAPESLVPLPQVDRVRVSGPDEKAVELRVGSGPITYAATDVPGLYRVQQLVANGQQTVEDDLFAANLADRDESDIRPRLSGLVQRRRLRSRPDHAPERILGPPRRPRPATPDVRVVLVPPTDVAA